MKRPRIFIFHRTFILFLFIAVFQTVPHSASAQNSILTYEQWAETLRKKSAYAEIVFKEIKIIGSADGTDTLPLGITVAGKVQFDDVTFIWPKNKDRHNHVDLNDVGKFAFCGVVFKDLVEFRNCTMDSVSMRDCIFENGLKFSGQSEPEVTGYPIELKKSTVKNYFFLNQANASAVRFIETIFELNPFGYTNDPKDNKPSIYVYPTFADKDERYSLRFSKCKVFWTDTLVNLNHKNYNRGAISNRGQIFRLDVMESQIFVPFCPQRIRKADDIRISKSHIKGNIRLNNIKIENNFTIQQSKLEGLISLKGVDFPTTSNIRFEHLQGKLVILNNDTTVFKSEESDNFEDAENFYELMAVYKALHLHYQARGDMPSANACYREMKQKDANYAHYLYQKNPSLENYFRLKINLFLDIYCGYATDPVRALLYSFYVVCFFGLAYLIFPSEPDNLHRAAWVRFWREWLDYLETNRQRSLRQTLEYRHELRELVQYRQALDQARSYSPRLILWLGRPYYHLSLLSFGFQLFWLRQTRHQHKPMNQLSGGQRFWVWLLSGAELFWFVSWGVIVRSFNALALSLNAFVTLGYGEIEAKGVARYLAVLEGLIGWFLLSIFTVSLVGQILQ